MNLQPVTQAAVTRHFVRLGHAGLYLGECVGPKPGYLNQPGRGDCRTAVRDDGTAYADIDGTPWRAYVCGRCAAQLIARTQAGS